MGLAVVIGWFIGYSLDNWLNTAPYLMLVWTGFGVAAGFRGLFRVAKKLEKKHEALEKKHEAAQDSTELGGTIERSGPNNPEGPKD